MSEDDHEVFMNAFEQTTVAAGWPPSQWSAVLIPCLIGAAQQAVYTVLLQDLPDFQKVTGNTANLEFKYRGLQMLTLRN